MATSSSGEGSSRMPTTSQLRDWLQTPTARVHMYLWPYIEEEDDVLDAPLNLTHSHISDLRPVQIMPTNTNSGDLF
jgi:hypothetical protein